MLRSSLWMLSLLIVMMPTVESQTRVGQTSKTRQGPAAAGPAQIATADHEVSGVEVALMEVKRTSADSVTIKFRYTNKTPEKKTLDHGGEGLNAWRFADAYFVVPSTNRKYTVLKDQNGQPVAANHQQFGVGITLAAKQAVNTWAKFPAPPPEVEKITVYLPGAPPFEDVAITK